jgi:citrate synthase
MHLTADLAENCQFEEIAYLLIYGRLPTADELREYIRTLASLRELPGALKDILERIPASAHPMVCYSLFYLVASSSKGLRRTSLGLVVQHLGYV